MDLIVLLKNLSDMSDHHSLSVSSCLKIGPLIRADRIEVPNEGLAQLLTNDDVEGIEGEESLLVENPRKETGERLGGDGLSMGQSELVDASIEQLPKVDSIGIHAGSKNVGVIGQLVNLGGVSMENRVASG